MAQVILQQVPEDPIPDGLASELRDRDPGVRMQAVKRLIRAVTKIPPPSPAIIEALLGILRGDENAETRKSATFALALMGTGQAEPAVVAEVTKAIRRDQNPSVRCRALYVLAVHRQADRIRVNDAMVAALRCDPDPTVRIHAAKLLGYYPPTDSTAADSLVEALRQDKNAKVRRIAARALGRICPDAAEALLAVLRHEQDPEVREDAVFALCGICPASPLLAVELVRVLRHDADPVLRSIAADALGSIRPTGPGAVQALVAAVQFDEDISVCEAAACALRTLQPTDPAVTTALLAVLREDHPDFRLAVAESLSFIPSTEEAAVLSLFELMQDENRRIARRAESVLKGIQMRAMPLLLGALRNGRAVLRGVRGELDETLHGIIREFLADREGADQLRVFLEVARSGSFNAAAGTLGLSNATAVRKIVKGRLEPRLRQCLQMKTLELVQPAPRKRDGIILTETGKSLAGWLYGQFGDLGGGFDQALIPLSCKKG